MMTDDQAEWEVLTTSAGAALLEEAGRVPRPTPTDLARWRKRWPLEAVSAALRLVEGRRKGSKKFQRADAMWFHPEGVEQATSEAVARHKAKRFSEARRVFDLCCGIGGDTIALGQVADRVLAVDRDQGMCRRTRWNAQVYEIADRVDSVRADAEAFPVPKRAFVHLDPDRRANAGIRRALAVRDYVPGMRFLKDIVRSGCSGAIKFGPASDFEQQFGGSDIGTEIELISLSGECKEATLWFGELATCRRCASRLPEGVAWTDRDGPRGAIAGVRPVDRFVFDPDPALIRSGLLDTFAVKHHLGRIAGDVDYLTGSTRIDTPFLQGFEVLEVLPFDLRGLRRRVRFWDLGPLEIKQKGLKRAPEPILKELRPIGTTPGTLLLAGGSERVQAILARRLGGGGSQWAVDGGQC